MLLAIAALIAMTVVLLGWVLLRPREDLVSQRLGLASSGQMPVGAGLEGSLAQRVVRPMLARMGAHLARLVPKNAIRGIEHMLVMAGEPMTLPVFMGVWGGLILLGGLALGYVALVVPNLTPVKFGVLALAIAPLCTLAPLVLLRRRVRSRQRAIVYALPYALDLLVTCVEAGLGVDAAFATVAEKTKGPLAQTFKLYLKQVSLGRPRRAAFAHVAERTGVPDLLRIANAVVQAEDMGTTLGDVLRTQAEELRATRRQRAQEAGQRAPVLMTIPLIICFLPAMVAVVIVPSVIHLLEFIGTLGGTR